MWARSSKTLIPGLLVIVLLSLAASSSSVIYKQGDWMRYRYDYESGGEEVLVDYKRVDN